MPARLPTAVLAHSRRVDITLNTTGKQSSRQYPFDAADSSNDGKDRPIYSERDFQAAIRAATETEMNRQGHELNGKIRITSCIAT